MHCWSYEFDSLLVIVKRFYSKFSLQYIFLNLNFILEFSVLWLVFCFFFVILLIL